MAYRRGHKRAGGRKKGTPNKSTVSLMELAEDLGVDPFEVLLLFAKGDWRALGYDAKTITKYSYGKAYEETVITAEHRLKAASEASQYLYPKRKAIEIMEIENKDRPMRDLSNETLTAIARKELK